MAAGPLRITHIITDGHPMGGAQFNTFYSLRYQQQDHQVELIMGSDGPLGDACREAGIPVHLIPMDNRLLSPLTDARALTKMVQHLRRSLPDIVHTHSSKAGVLGRVAARLAGVSVVVHTLHAPSFHDRQPAVARWLIQGLERVLVRYTDTIVTVADAIGEDFVRRGLCPPDRLRTVVSGIDLTRLSEVAPEARAAVRQGFSIPQDAVTVVSIGHLSRRKNHDLLLDVATEILRSRGDVYFLIVGEGEEREALSRKIVANALQQHVFLCGLRGDVGSVLAASDVFVQTSWHEGVSRSLVEAIYMGLPAVATDVVGTREVVREGENGFLVPPGDAATLVNRILTLAGDQRLRVDMGRRGQQMVSRSRSIEAMGSALDLLYRELIERKDALGSLTGSRSTGTVRN